MSVVTRHDVLCDPCGDGTTEGTHQVKFGNEGQWYTLDLCDSHEQGYQESVNSLLKNATPVKTGRRAASDGPSASEIREWAATNGIEVSARGRIPETVKSAYATASA